MGKWAYGVDEASYMLSDIAFVYIKFSKFKTVHPTVYGLAAIKAG